MYNNKVNLVNHGGKNVGDSKLFFNFFLSNSLKKREKKFAHLVFGISIFLETSLHSGEGFRIVPC